MGGGVANTFPRGISLKVNAIVQLEFKLGYYNATIQYVSYYTIKTPSTTYYNVTVQLIGHYGMGTL